MNTNNPSWRIDELSRRVLVAAKWPSAASVKTQNPTPHLDELERALEIHLSPLALPNNGHAGDGSVKTCTVPSGLTQQHESDEETKREVWTWTPQAQNIENSYVKSPLQQDNTITAASDGTTLEEMAPFSPEFYRAMGELAKEAFQPGSVKDLHMDEKSNETTIPTDGSNRDTATKHALLSLEQYSLPRMHDAFRITRILLSMQELHVGSNEEEKFITNLLHYCEGMSISETKEERSDTTSSSSSSSSSTNTNTNKIKHNKGKRIPVLSALFHHWSRLPELENAIQQLSRRYNALLPMTADEFWELYAESSSDSSGTTGGATSFLGARAVKIESFKRRLEEELQCHVNGDSNGDDSRGRISQGSPEEGGLVVLLAVLYESSDATLRGKCRRWIGQWLRSFALGSGSSLSHSAMRGIGGSSADGDDGLGPSFGSFCPLFVSPSFGMANSSNTSIAPAGMGPISITHAGGGGGGMPQNHLGMQNTSGCGIDALLHVLLRIISGFVYLPTTGSSKESGTRSKILRASHESLLFDCLIPLHRPSGMVLWRDQTPLIGLYHEVLVKCIGTLVSVDRTLIDPVIGALLHPDIWPTEGSKGSTSSGRGSGANTPKLILLLHEVDTLISLLRKRDDSEDQIESNLSSFDAHFSPLVSRLCLCISSDNSRISEQSLQMFRNDTFSVMVRRRVKEAGPKFIRALCRCSTNGKGFEVSWNPTVRKMTFLVLSQLEGYYNHLDSTDNEPSAFSIACEEAVSGTISASDEMHADKKESVSGTAILGSRPSGGITSFLGNDMTSLRGAMGNWRPPPKKKQGIPHVGVKTQPPLTITGAAPWASGSQNGARKPASKKQPPLTVTGVAPWAIKKESYSQNTSIPARSFATSLPRPPAKKHISSSLALGKPISSATDSSVEVCLPQIHEKEASLDAVSRVRSYMAQLKPAGDADNSADGVSAWAKAQMEESPVILPTLKFHDLVFGQELGTGAFSTVKYARQILKDKTRSHWPEFAVKIVSTQKIEALGYEQSINREIAILRTISHPGISRLISSFRFREGAYLVLEFASGGDLHTLLRKNGSLDHESTKFVIGSVAAALWSIHERGFVFVDIKPENILITESGHIKLTDFGGCRPVTQEAKLSVKGSSENLLKELRDGDWKQAAPKKTEQKTEQRQHIEDVNMNVGGDDLRIEGTTAYLPPEVVIGGLPTYAADIWALGCVLFQCLSGRPPILEDTDHLTAQRIVSFHLSDGSSDVFVGCDETAFNDCAKTLVQQMLHREAPARPDIFEISQSAFFDGVDIFNLHKKPAHPLDVGSIAPVSDAKWARRQFSSIWAPQPHVYDIGGTSNVTTKARNSWDSAILEGGERDETFATTQKAILTKISE
eukprot:scaffold12938_cov138-Skeletonema_marinoi.AAC.2